MKKTLTALITAGVLLGAAACSAAPTMSNEDTCARIQAIGEGSGQSSSSGKTGMIRLANQLRPVEATASPELSAPLQSFIDFLDKSAKEPAKPEDMQAAYTKFGEAYSKVCSR